MSGTVNLSDDSFTFRHTAGFKQLFYTRKTGCNIAASRNTTGVEGAQGKLGAWLANRLGSHDTYSRTQFDHFATAQIHTVALRANAVDQVTSQGRTDFHGIDIG